MDQVGGADFAGGGGGAGSLDLDAAPSPEAYQAGKVEQRGIELIPESDRRMRPSGLFWMWAGALWNVEFLVYGALMLYFGLSFWQAVLAIIVGNLAYAFLGWASLPGPETGTTAFMVSRAPFGRNGNRAPSLFNWITQVGFEVEGIVLIVLIIEAMFSHEGIPLGDAAKVVVIIAAVAVQFVVPFLGHATITKVLRYLSLRVHRCVRGHGDSRRAPRPPQEPAHRPAPTRGGSGRPDSCSSSRLEGSAGPKTPPTTRATCRAIPRRAGRSGRRRSVPRYPRSCSSCWVRPPIW